MRVILTGREREGQHFSRFFRMPDALLAGYLRITFHKGMLSSTDSCHDSD